ncbi:MAG: tetratricopeptide repeat protein, partial [Planctomycetes bacterium]|nr:tetratricopeptide repeat protein [Planctomycetota bacterium]
IKDYDEAVRLDPKFQAEAYLNLAWLLATCPNQQFRDVKRATQVAKTACEISHSKSAWELTALAATYAEAGQFDEAERVQSLALADKHSAESAGDYFRMLVDLYKNKRTYRGPIQHPHPTVSAPFRPERAVPRDDATFFFERGRDFWDMKEYDNAIKAFDEAIRLKPNHWIFHLSRGAAWHRKKEFDKAIHDFDDAIRIDPEKAIAYLNRALAWEDKKDYDKALRDLNDAIRLDPTNAFYYFNRGNVWEHKKDLDKAVKDFQEAVRLNPKDQFYQSALVETQRKLVTEKNLAIFARAQKFVDTHPKIQTPDFGISKVEWELATRPFRTKSTLTRFEHEQLLDFLGRAIKHAPYNSDPSFAAVIADLKLWDFTYPGK